jgi:hypothetical protein
MYTHIVALGLFSCITVSLAQNSALISPPEGGNLTAKLTPAANPASLFELIRRSNIIVEGTIVSTLPVINTAKQQAIPSLETHSMVAIDAVLAGVVPNHSANILLTQVGGHLDKWDITVPDDPLVIPGERYILFLVPDDRKALPNVSGIPRYAVIGIWSGKIKIVDDKVAFGGPSYPTLHAYDGTDVNLFLQTLREAIRRPYTTTPLPINLAPKQ